METLIYNHNDLKDEEMNEVVTRIKVIIINRDNQMLLARSNGMYFLPGGHLEENETLLECLNREVKEETGIDLDIKKAEPFFKIMHYTKNYHGRGKNRISEIYYFAVNTDKDVDEEAINLTAEEIKNGFHIVHVDIKEVREFLTNSVTFENDKSEIIVNEILEALDKFKEYYGFEVGEEYAQI